MADEITPLERVLELLREHRISYCEYTRNELKVFGIDYCKQCDDFRNEIVVAGEYIEVVQKYLTPEQAIAVTVGHAAHTKPNAHDLKRLMEVE